MSRLKKLAWWWVFVTWGGWLQAASDPSGYYAGRLTDGRAVQVLLRSDASVFAGRVQIDGDPSVEALRLSTNREGQVEYRLSEHGGARRGGWSDLVLSVKPDRSALVGEVRGKGNEQVVGLSAARIADVGEVSRKRGLTVAGRGGSKSFHAIWPAFRGDSPLLQAVAKRFESEAGGEARNFTAGAYGLLWEGLKGDGMPREWEGSVEVCIVALGTNWLSVRELRYEYTGGAHGLALWVGRTFVRVGNTVRELSLGDLFQAEAPWVARLSSLCLTALRAQGAAWTLDTASENMRVTGFEAKDLVAFSVAHAGLTLHFPSYSVAPYSDGLFDVLIPWKDLDGLLRDDARRWFVPK